MECRLCWVCKGRLHVGHVDFMLFRHTCSALGTQKLPNANAVSGGIQAVWMSGIVAKVKTMFDNLGF